MCRLVDEAKCLGNCHIVGNHIILLFATYKITESLCALPLVDSCVKMRVCKHGYEVSDLLIFLRIIL